ncbi:hypothetical protein ACLOJK_039915 [Asimina triloba]
MHQLLDIGRLKWALLQLPGEKDGLIAHSVGHSWCEVLVLKSNNKENLVRRADVENVVQEFGLIDKKELAPLQELIESIVSPY